MTADSTSSNHHSPRTSRFSGGGLSSPQLRRNNLSSPWVQVVRGESESVSEAVVQHSPSSPSTPPPPPSLTSTSESTDKLSSSMVASVSSTPVPDNSTAIENLDANNSSNAARPKKPAWNKPSNGVLEVGPVMGAASWPALSESTKSSPKSSLADSSSSKSLSDGSVSNNQVPIISNLTSKITNPNASPSLNTNRAMAARQRLRHGGGLISSGDGPAQTGLTRSPQPAPLPPPLPQAFTNAMSPNGVGNLLQVHPDPSPIEPPYRGNNWETRQAGGFVSQSHPVNEHRSSSRRGNYGPRRDGTYHNNYGGRREQDRGNYANARYVHMQQQRGPLRSFVRSPPLNAGTFVAPQPIRPFVNPYGFPDFIYLPTQTEHIRSFMTVPVLMPVAEPSLQAMLVHQIDYYFSDENLAKDEFLKSNMDDQGWVPITLIASFPRVKNLTNNIQLILDSLRTSIVVEINEEKVRRRHDWMKYIPPFSRVLTESGLPSPSGSSYGAFTTSFQKITLEEEDKANPHSEDLHFSETTGQSKLCNGDGPELTLSNHI